MSRKILIFSYWFPPNNAIGASRAAAMAKFFLKEGWDVTVIAARSAAVPEDFPVDLPDIEVHRVSDTPQTRFMNIRLGRKFLARAASTMMRYFAFPDVFKSTTARMGERAEELLSQGREFDAVLSTALPFSQHVQAVKIARSAKALLVLDNRDAWACNDYRRRPPLSDARERAFEARTFAQADLIASISDSMTRYYKETYPDLSGKFTAIRNGVDQNRSQSGSPAPADGDAVRIVYTGILYGAKRDVRPVLEAARMAALPVAFDFYGSEPGSVAKLQREYPDIAITAHGRVSRAEALAAQQRASVLLVALGTDEAEKTFLPGKFFEYVGTGRPIIVLADADYEISQLVDEFQLGLASRDRAELARFLRSVASGEIAPRAKVPAPLTRAYQLEKLQSQIVALLDAEEPAVQARG